MLGRAGVTERFVRFRTENARMAVVVSFDDPFDAALLLLGIEERAAELRAESRAPELHEYDRVGMADTVRVLDAVAAQLTEQISSHPLYVARMRHL